MPRKMNSTEMPLGTTRSGNDTLADGEGQHLLGIDVLFEHINYADTGRFKTKISDDSREFCARLVRNVSGSTRSPRLVVQYGTTAGDWGKNINSLCAVNVGWAGVVDPFLASAAADDAIHWIVTEGPCDVENDDNGTIAIADYIVTGTSGRVREQTAAPASDTATLAQVRSYLGRAEEAESDGASNATFRVNIGKY